MLKEILLAIVVVSPLILVLGPSALGQTPCPRDLDSWNAWREQLLVGKANPQELLFQGGRLLDQCSQDPALRDVFSNPHFRTCMEPLRKTLEVMRLQTLTRQMDPQGHSMGFVLADDQYFNASRLDFPAMLALPPIIRQNQSLLRTLTSKRSTPLQIQRAIENLIRRIPGIRILEYSSQHLVSTDPNRQVWGRLLFYIPGANYDQWIQFSRDLNPGSEPTRAISLVSVQTRDRTGRQLSRPTVLFNDFFRNQHSNGSISIATRRSAMGGRLENCFTCHQTGVNPIIPTPTPAMRSFTPNLNAQTVLAAMNNRIAAYGATRIDGVDAEGYGPPMGPVDPLTRSEEFIRQCSGRPNLPSNRIAIIRRSMNCANCHNNVTMNALRWPLGTARGFEREQDQNPTSRDLLRMALQTGHMPPSQTQLTVEDREIVRRCLVEEYYAGFTGLTESSGSNHGPGVFLQWLSPAGCEARRQIDTNEPTNNNSSTGQTAAPAR